jgi:hypothetical protein
MATSGSNNFTLTARQVVNFALKKLGVLEAGGSASPEDADDATEELEMLLKGMAKKGPYIFTVQPDGTVPLVADTRSYALTALKPLRLLEVRYSDANDREIPMTELTRTEYFELPIKTSRGVPTNYWFDADGSTYTLYVWPVLATANGDTVEFTYQRKIQDIDNLANHIDIPEEWLDTVGYRLAKRLIPTFGVKGERAQNIRDIDAELWQDAMDYGREALVTMRPERRYG